MNYKILRKVATYFGVLLRLFTHTAIISRFPRTSFAGLRNDSRLRTPSGSTLRTGPEPTNSKKPPPGRRGPFSPRHLTPLSSVREKG